MTDPQGDPPRVPGEGKPAEIVEPESPPTMEEVLADPETFALLGWTVSPDQDVVRVGWVKPMFESQG